jgi:hypothetical protein
VPNVQQGNTLVTVGRRLDDMDDVDGCAASLVGDAGLIVRNALREPWHGYATRLSQAPGSCGRKLRWQG